MQKVVPSEMLFYESLDISFNELDSSLILYSSSDSIHHSASSLAKSVGLQSVVILYKITRYYIIAYLVM